MFSGPVPPTSMNALHALTKQANPTRPDDTGAGSHQTVRRQAGRTVSHPISTAATSSTSAATATGCDATWNSPRPSIRPLPGPSPPNMLETRKRDHDHGPSPLGSPRSGRYAPSAGATPDVCIFRWPLTTLPISIRPGPGLHGYPGTQCNAQNESGRLILCIAGRGVTGRAGIGVPGRGRSRHHRLDPNGHKRDPAGLDVRPASADPRDAARVAATRSHGLSGSDLSPTAKAAAVHPVPPDPEVVANPPRGSEPGHNARTRTAGPRFAASRRSPAHSASIERPFAGDHRRFLARLAATRWRLCPWPIVNRLNPRPAPLLRAGLPAGRRCRGAPLRTFLRRQTSSGRGSQLCPGRIRGLRA